MNEQEIERDEDLLVKDLIIIRGRIEDTINHIQRGRKIDAEERAKSARGLINEVLFELRGDYDDDK